MEAQKKPRIAKAILRKKNGAGGSGSLTSDCTTKLQSSKLYGTGTKTEMWLRGTREKKSPELNPHTYSQLIYGKEALIHSGEKTVPLISDAGTTGQPHVKE